MPEGTLQLEHLMQATKLLQLKKASLPDIEIIFDVCWMLTPTQIQKLVANCAPLLALCRPRVRKRLTSSPLQTTSPTMRTRSRPRSSGPSTRGLLQATRTTTSCCHPRCVLVRRNASSSLAHRFPHQVEEAGQYETPLPREVTGIEVSDFPHIASHPTNELTLAGLARTQTYIPAHQRAPHLRQLVQIVASM